MLNAQVLFYTDFCTTPAGFAAASKRADAKGSDDTLLINDSGATAPKIAVIDGCTLSVAKSSTGRPCITISKSTQTCVKFGDTAGCTPGRLSLKNSNNSITFPSVTGPCKISYYAASSSKTAGRSIQCVVNGVSTPEAGIPELLREDSQATVKVVYSCPAEGPVVFKLIAQGGAVYLYDVKIEAGAVGVVWNWTARNNAPILTKDNNIINGRYRANVEVFTLAGKKVILPDAKLTLHSFIPKGIYLIRIPESDNNVTASINLSQ